MGDDGTDREEMDRLAIALRPAVERLAQGWDLAPDGRAFLVALAAIRRRESMGREMPKAGTDHALRRNGWLA